MFDQNLSLQIDALKSSENIWCENMTARIRKKARRLSKKRIFPLTLS